jgi:D-alanine--D-alanine ligase
MKQKRLTVALLCGGPSPERGISLNSARSVCDHLSGSDVDVVPFYFDYACQPYQVSRAQLYSNTPSDFDFKLSYSARPLSMDGLKRELKKVDLAFPLIHGAFGDDGQLIGLLEKWGVRTVGPSSSACSQAWHKIRARQRLATEGFYTLPALHFKKGQKLNQQNISQFLIRECKGKAVVKPAQGGSSIGVHVVGSAQEAMQAINALFKGRYFKEVLVEPFCSGVEFTTVVLQNRFGQAVSLLPIDIEANYQKGEILDYRRKYLASNQVAYHIPPRFSAEVTDSIRSQAEQIFSLFGFYDFLRIDGWVLDGGEILFSDINPISGMEQNSFFFIGCSQLGMSHQDAVRFLVRSACRRHGLEWKESSERSNGSNKRRVHVLFGGTTAERQVSLMSGTNVWLKLRRSKRYEPIPFLLDNDHKVWRLPYHFTLRHTVEEIQELCSKQLEVEHKLNSMLLPVARQLALRPGEATEPFLRTRSMSLKEFIKSSPAIFNTVHGGIGENGIIQGMCEEAGVVYNGCGAAASQLCMDKYETGRVISNLKNRGVTSAPKKLFAFNEIAEIGKSEWGDVWSRLLKVLGSKTVIVKPRGDGCSAGIVRLFTSDDFKRYCAFVLHRDQVIPPNTLTDQVALVEMPSERVDYLICEPFIESDRVSVFDNQLEWKRVSDIIEVTVGVLGFKGKLRAMNPSITVASGNILSLEEKFQGGTGVNITPPPPKFVSPSVCAKVKKAIEIAGNALGIEGYARIDAFINRLTGEVMVIEANTLPGLTGSTVFYHQGLAEKVPLYPTELLEKIMDFAFEVRGGKRVAISHEANTRGKQSCVGAA